MPGQKPVILHNPEIVAMLENALNDARAGRMVGMALVAVYGPDNMQVRSTGMHTSTLATGCTQLGIIIGQTLFAKRKPGPVS
jgi:threonine/homoserine/homoserine lactone efflux protein